MSTHKSDNHGHHEHDRQRGSSWSTFNQPEPKQFIKTKMNPRWVAVFFFTVVLNVAAPLIYFLFSEDPADGWPLYIATIITSIVLYMPVAIVSIRNR